MRVAYLEEKDETFTGMCECSFASRGWPSSESAQARIEEHRAEHETGGQMKPLAEFRAKHKLVVSGGQVFPEGAVEIEKED